MTRWPSMGGFRDKFQFTTYGIRCQGCGKQRHITRYEGGRFLTIDGWDELGDYYCLSCTIKSWIRSKVRVPRLFMKRLIEVTKYTRVMGITDRKLQLKIWKALMRDTKQMFR